MTQSTRGTSTGSVVTTPETQIAVARQFEGHPTVVVRKSAPDGTIIAQIPNGTHVILTGARTGDYLEVSAEKEHDFFYGWVKKPNLSSFATIDIDADYVWSVFLCIPEGLPFECIWTELRGSVLDACTNLLGQDWFTRSWPGSLEEMETLLQQSMADTRRGLVAHGLKRRQAESLAAELARLVQAEVAVDGDLVKQLMRQKCIAANRDIISMPPAAGLGPAVSIQPSALHPALAGPSLQIPELPEDFLVKTSRQLQRADLYKKIGSPDTILTYLLQTQCICLLSGRWLVERFKDGVRFLPRRQEMPAAAYWTPGDLFKSLDPSAMRFEKDAKVLVALSYGWIQRGHPDRDAWHLSQVVSFLTHVFTTKDVEDVALFWDFYSLDQLPRDAAAHLRFKTALKFMNVLYGYGLCHILRLNNLPPGIKPTWERGWPFFEEAIFSTARRAHEIFVLTCSDRDMLINSGDPEKSRSRALIDALQVARSVPMDACCFQRQLQDKTFTGKGDKEEVDKMYADNFAIMKQEDLVEIHTSWNISKAHQLATALYHYQRLKCLIIEGEGFDDDCCAELLRHADLQSKPKDFLLTLVATGASKEAKKEVQDVAAKRSSH